MPAITGHAASMSHIRYEVEDGIGTITIDRPEKRNAMTYAMLGEFIATIGKAGADDKARVLIVTGSGGAFCAGTDLADLATIPGEDRGVRGTAEEHDVWWPLVACPKPVIGAIDGAAVGMGAEFTSQCDVRIATTRARFAWNFVHRGLVPDTGAGSWLLPRLIGVPAALDLLYSGRFLEAAEALSLGYVAEVVEPDDLLATAQRRAQAWLAGSPFSQRRIKELTYRGLERDVTGHMTGHVQALQECFKSADHKEGVAAFLERREAQFTGR
jgi:enoyl-CoA hydratase/carnithine racemase